MAKSQGDKVVADEPIVELETDKVNVKVPAPSNGVLGSIDVQEGETVNVGSLLGTISKNLAKDTSGSNEIKNYSPPKKKDNEKNIKLFDNDQKTSEAKKINKTKIEKSILKLEEESKEIEEEPLILEKIHTEKSQLKKTNQIKKETIISPAARKMASEANVDINKVTGTGKNGTIPKRYFKIDGF